jgi:hypothetical protein
VPLVSRSTAIHLSPLRPIRKFDHFVAGLAGTQHRMVALQSADRATLLLQTWEQSLRMVEMRTQLIYEESISTLHGAPSLRRVSWVRTSHSHRTCCSV